MSQRPTKPPPAPRSARGPFASFVAAPGLSSGRLSELPRRATLSVAEAHERAARAARRLAEDSRVRLVFLFGSAASGDRGAVGDVDLAVLTRPALSLRQLLTLRAGLAAAVGPGLDLVSIDEASVVLAWEIVEHGECLYAADPSEHLELVTRVRSRYWDFQPFLRTQWRLTGRRLEERLRRGAQA